MLLTSVRHSFKPFLALAFAALAWSCSKSSVVAPTDASISLSAGPAVISTNGSTTISALVTDKGGVPVQDGTLVNFQATIGTLQPPQARTKNGQATAQLSAPNLQGTASVSATSGSITAQAITVTIVGPLGVVITAQPQTAALNTIVQFTASVTPANGPAIQQFAWDFGDNKTATTSTGTTSHVYGTTGPMVVKVTATAADGTKPVAQIEVLISAK